MKVRLLLVGVLVAASGGIGGVASAAGSCETPRVNVLTDAEAAVSRPALRAPSEYALSNVYAQNQLVTKPQFVYAEAGPQYAGAFEALAPAGTPPPPRAVSAYPSDDIPDDDEESWGGTSTTEVTSTSALATSAGSHDPGVEGLSLDSGRSFVTTVVECETTTIIAGWKANNVVVGAGTAYEQLGETVTLVVGPDGSSADVEVTAVRADEGGEVPVEGRPLDPFTDPMREGGGPTLEAGEPRTETADGYASATGGGFNFLFADPETGQGANYRIGSVVATITVLGELTEPIAPPVTAITPETIPAAPPVQPTAEGTTSARTGTPPAPSAEAVRTVETQLVSDVEALTLEVSDRNWLPLWALLAVAVLGGSWWATVAVGRHDYPTLDWIARRSGRSGARFIAQYLRW